jgi:molybdopterin-guanine dinucleotide biosynthesis protein MobB
MNIRESVVLGFYGESNTGKTTTIVKLIKKLKNDNLKVAVIKVTKNDLFLDTKGKDTYRFGEADCNNIVFLSNIEMDFIFKNKLSLISIIETINNIGFCDVVLIEGCDSKSLPKIRFGKNKDIRENTIFDYDGNVEKIYNYIIERIQKQRDSEIELFVLKVNGKKILLSDVTNRFIKNTLLSMVSNLKGVNCKISDLEISFENGKN